MAWLKTAQDVSRKALNIRGFRSCSFDSSVSKIHYFDAQSKGGLPPFIFLHGIGSSANGFSALLPKVKRATKRLLAPDSPGHGGSSVPENGFDLDTIYAGLVEFLDAKIERLGEPIFLYGSSLGGAMSLKYAMERPQNLRGLLLSSPAGAPIPEEEMEQLKELFQMRSRHDARYFLNRLFHKRPWYSRLIEPIFFQLMSRSHIEDFFDSVQDSSQAFTPEQLGALEMPLLLMWGESERILPASCLHYYKEHLPEHAKIEIPEGVGHSPHIERPGVMARRIIQFANGVVEGA